MGQRQEHELKQRPVALAFPVKRPQPGDDRTISMIDPQMGVRLEIIELVVEKKRWLPFTQV